MAQSLPDDPDDLRRFTALLLAEVKSQAMLIEKLRYQLAGHRSHRFGTSSETIEQLQLALEASEISIAKMTATLRLPDEEKDKPKRRPIPDHIPRQEIELTTGRDDCFRCGGTLRRLGEDGEAITPLVRVMAERGTGVRARAVRREPHRAAALRMLGP